MIIAVSDVHLGYANSNKADFARFLDWIAIQPDVTDIVLAGDILEFWRCDMVAVLIENADIIARLIDMCKTGVRVHYVAGNHDYTVRHLEIFPNRFKFSLKTKLVEDGVEYMFSHGHELDPKQNPVFYDALCFTNYAKMRQADHIWKVYSKWIDNPVKYTAAWFRKWWSTRDIETMLQSPEERGYVAPFAPKTMLSTTMEGTVAVSGHTHVPCVHADENRVDLGSWVYNKHRTFNTYAAITGGEIQLRRFG